VSYPEGDRSVAPGYRPGLYARDPDDPAYSTTGLTGDPRLATREKGERALAIMTARWLEALRAFAYAPLVRRD
jgi:creatinine amidohydrolase/Fe(II)-dependent formamide hydrolase-like protein